ncbi:hypothetical protein Tco_0532479 [Tanacetum coccineum]
MGDENPIRTLGDYSKPSHEGYMNTIELPVGNNVVPLRSDTIRLVQNGCSFYGLRSEDPNQYVKDFLKLLDSLDLDTSNWLERLPARSITTWEDLTTRFLAQLRNDILMFQQHHGESLSEAWTHVLSISDRRLIKLENQVQRLMEAHLAPLQPTQVNKITTTCEICSGPLNTQYCMKDPKQAFVEYASSHTDEARGNFTYVVDFMIVEDISYVLDPRLSQVVLGKPFVEISNMTHDPPKGVVRFANRNNEVTYKMPHMIEQYNSLSNLEKEHTKSVYLRNEEDKRRGVEYVMSKILGFYKECVELGPEYATGMEDEGEVT